jgi:molecular chaperone GrpE
MKHRKGPRAGGPEADPAGAPSPAPASPPAGAEARTSPAGEAAPAPGPFAPGAASPEADPAAIRAELERARAREDELLRALAELANVQKRRRQEMETVLRYASEPLLRELLPVLDDLERALAAMAGREEDPLRRGVALVQDRLWRTLEREGLEVIRPEGAQFDPELHDALLQRPAPGVPPHTVIEVVKPGYRYRGRVLRHAQVVVASEEAPEDAAGAPRDGARAPAPDAAGENRT